MLPRFIVVFTLALAACVGKPDAAAESAASATPASATPAAPITGEDPLVRADKARIKGAESAKVWFIMASDFQCPYCQAFHAETWPEIDRDYVKTGKVRVAFLNHPMENHGLAIPAAEAAMCAGRQDRFWPMHDSLFHHQDKWVNGANAQQVFETLASSIGLNMDEWRSCMSTHAMRPMVEADFERSKRVGVRGTPSFIIGDGVAIVGALPYADFRRALDSALARAGR